MHNEGTLDAMAGEMTTDVVMASFLEHLRAHTGYLSLSLKDATVLHLVRTFRWRPSQVEELTDRELRLILHTNWQLFLAQEPEIQRNVYLHVLAKREVDAAATWRTTAS